MGRSQNKIRAKIRFELNQPGWFACYNVAWFTLPAIMWPGSLLMGLSLAWARVVWTCRGLMGSNKVVARRTRQEVRMQTGLRWSAGPDLFFPCPYSRRLGSYSCDQRQWPALRHHCNSSPWPISRAVDSNQTPAIPFPWLSGTIARLGWEESGSKTVVSNLRHNSVPAQAHWRWEVLKSGEDCSKASGCVMYLARLGSEMAILHFTTTVISKISKQQVTPDGSCSGSKRQWEVGRQWQGKGRSKGSNTSLRQARSAVDRASAALLHSSEGQLPISCNRAAPPWWQHVGTPMVLFWDKAKFRLQQRRKLHGAARPCSGSSFASSSGQQGGSKMVQVRGGEASKWNSNRQRLCGDNDLLPGEASPDRPQGGGNE